MANPQLPTNEDCYTKSRTFGLFVPPVNGTYNFSITADDGAQVFLSTDETRENMVSIINVVNYMDLKAKLVYPESISKPIFLIAGRSYYLEIQHYQLTGASVFDLGVEMPYNGTNQLPFIQNITIYPTFIIREVQQIMIGGTHVPTGGYLVIKYGSITTNKIS